MFRNQSVSTHQFAMVPRADIPRSSFRIQTGHKTSFNSGLLIPVYVNEILPGDTFNLKMTAFCRMATPIYPIMDNLHLDSFFFFVPCRLVWDNWQRFMGEQDDPADSISYVIPQVVSTSNGFSALSLFDYMGCPINDGVQVVGPISVNALPSRAYNLIWNQWFRDENLQDSEVVDMDDGPDDPDSYELKRRGKRHDYFTSCLPWTQKGGIPVSLPLGGTAPVISDPAGGGVPSWYRSTGAPGTDVRQLQMANASTGVLWAPTGTPPTGTGSAAWSTTALVADLSTATAATINQIRQAFQIQKLLERDARGGSRYTEIVRAHFGVMSPDARLQRPEYLGGGHTAVVINPIAQTSATDVTGSSTPIANLSAYGTALAHGHGFTQSFTEHGYVIGLVAVRADLTYQQGLRKMWSRSTRYDFYFPAFAMLGEQAVLNRELYVQGNATDALVFGYQERWAEYRYHPSMITGLMRSTFPTPIDQWHLAQHFTALPLLNASFIEDVPPMERILAVGAASDGQEFLFDGFFDITAGRAMPMYSVPGLVDHF